jgi:choline-sulfatase
VNRPFRRTSILILAALGAGLAAVGAWRHARAPTPVNGPIILISIDTLRADHLPVYGYRKVKTPAIDALAADGIVFERAYSHAPQTLPAHTSILSGRLPFETGVRDNLGFTVKPGERLLPQMLRERGYATGGAVSAYVLRKETGIGRGFDFFDDEMASSSPGATLGEVQRDGGATEAVAERWLETRRSARVFLFLHLYEPHKPYTPPARFGEYAPYDGEIAYSDEIVGRLIRYLRTHDLYDRSTIVLLADHGEGLGDHGEQEHGLFVYDEAIHVPLIIKQAGQAGRGRRIPDLVQHIDIVPTLLDLVGAPIPGELRGRSLKPLLAGTGRLAGQGLYAEATYGRYHFGWSELTALTDGRYRYIEAPREELYDLDRDPRELTNIIGEGLPVRQALRSAIDRLVAGATFQNPSGVSAEARERLQSLGYVGSAPRTTADPAADLADPKDKVEILKQYRAAGELAAKGKWGEAMVGLHRILAIDGNMADVWDQLGVCAVRYEQYEEAVDAYRHAIELNPGVSNYYVGAAVALMSLGRLDEAREHAELAVQLARDRGPREAASAYSELVGITLAQHDAEGARQVAKLAQEAEPDFPLPAYVEGRLLHEQGRYAEALPAFERTLAGLRASQAPTPLDLHFYTGDTLARLDRNPEAESEFLEELRAFPQNTRARGALAMLYQASGHPEAAARVIGDLTSSTPTRGSYALAARLWVMFGKPRQAEMAKAQARELFDRGAAGRPATR